MHVDSLEVILCGRSLPTSCVWGNYCKQLALRRTATAPLSSASCYVVCVCGGGGKCEDCISCNVDKFNTDVSAWEDSIHRINISTWCCSAVSISDLSKDHGCMG